MKSQLHFNWLLPQKKQQKQPAVQDDQNHPSMIRQLICQKSLWIIYNKKSLLLQTELRTLNQKLTSTTIDAERYYLLSAKSTPQSWKNNNTVEETVKKKIRGHLNWLGKSKAPSCVEERLVLYDDTADSNNNNKNNKKYL